MRHSSAAGDGPVTFVRSLMVPGRGPATLAVTVDLNRAWVAGWELGAGLGLLAVSALAALWLVYRHVRQRLAALGLIREALAAVGGPVNGRRRCCRWRQAWARRPRRGTKFCRRRTGHT